MRSTDYIHNLTMDARRERARWNGKVITTERQWRENDNGSREVAGSSLKGIKFAIMESFSMNRYDVQNYVCF